MFACEPITILAAHRMKWLLKYFSACCQAAVCTRYNIYKETTLFTRIQGRGHATGKLADGQLEMDYNKGTKVNANITLYYTKQIIFGRKKTLWNIIFYWSQFEYWVSIQMVLVNFYNQWNKLNSSWIWKALHKSITLHF